MPGKVYLGVLVAAALPACSVDVQVGANDLAAAEVVDARTSAKPQACELYALDPSKPSDPHLGPRSAIATVYVPEPPDYKGTFSVHLAQRPERDTIVRMSNDVCTVRPTTLTFRPENYGTGQPVFVRCDPDAEETTVACAVMNDPAAETATITVRVACSPCT